MDSCGTYSFSQGMLWLRAYSRELCARHCAEAIDCGTFPDFVDELVARWQEHDKLWRQYVRGPGRLALPCLLPLVERADLNCIVLPNGDAVRLRLQRARSEASLRKSPRRVLLLPHRCSCAQRGVAA